MDVIAVVAALTVTARQLLAGGRLAGVPPIVLTDDEIVDYQVLSIDKEGMKKALKAYQKYLSY